MVHPSSDASATVSPVGISRRHERLAISALALAAFVIAVNVNLVGAMMPFLAEDSLYAVPSGDAAASASVRWQLLWSTSAAAALASLLLGPVVDRVGRRPPMLVGGLLFVGAMAGHLVARDHAQLLVCRVVSGLGGGMVFTSASAAVADLVPYQRRGAAMGLFSLGLFLATPLGLPVALWIADTSPGAWRWSFGWLAGPGLLAIFAFMRLLPASVGRSGQSTTQLEVLRAPHVLPALLSVLLYTGAFFTAIQVAPTWLDDSGLVPRHEQPFLWIVLGFSTAAGALVLPRIGDRVGNRGVVLFTSAGVAVCLLLLARVETLLALWLVGIPFTLLAAARSPSLQALMSELVEPRMRGTLMGLRAVAVNVGAFAFAGVGTAVYAERGYTVLLWLCAAGVVVAYFLIRLFVKVRL